MNGNPVCVCLFSGLVVNHFERMKSCHLQQHGWTLRVINESEGKRRT